MKKLFILIILFTLLGCSTEYSTESTEEPTTDQQTYTTIDQLDKFPCLVELTHAPQRLTWVYEANIHDKEGK
jgi:antibiotic biosynthesis monooxygenase (ABM) superfamily enzyme